MEVGKLLVAGTLNQIANTGIQVATGNTVQRPSTAAGYIRYNTDISNFEFANATAWTNLGSVSSVALSSTSNGLSISGSPITTSGTFTVNITGELAGLEGLGAGGTGIVERTGTGSYTAVPVLAVANGGTGANTAVGALSSLGALPTAGGTMTGTLTLASDPTSALQASTKQYVDNATANAIAADTYSAGSGLTNTAKTFSVNTSGVSTAIVSGNVVVRASGVNGQVLLSGATAGAEATWGALNLASSNAVTGILPLADGGTGANTAVAALASLGALPTAGGTMTGALVLASNPTTALQAATKQYVDNAVSNAVSADMYTVVANGGLSIVANAFSANTTGVTTGLVGGNIAVRSTATAGQTLLSSGTAGGEATWGALNLASANAVTGVLPVTNGGTGANSVASFRAAFNAPGVYRQSFTSATLASNLLTVTHSLGQQFVSVTVSDNNNLVIQPDSITFTSSSVTTIDFTSYVNAGMTGTFNVTVIG